MLQGQVSLRRGLPLKCYLRIGLAVFVAVWLLFWFFEAMSPRMELIAVWEVQHLHQHRVTATPGPRCGWQGGMAWCDDVQIEVTMTKGGE